MLEALGVLLLKGDSVINIKIFFKYKMKELIIVANGQTGCQIADHLWDIFG